MCIKCTSCDSVVGLVGIRIQGQAIFCSIRCYEYFLKKFPNQVFQFTKLTDLVNTVNCEPLTTLGPSVKPGT